MFDNGGAYKTDLTLDSFAHYLLGHSRFRVCVPMHSTDSDFYDHFARFDACAGRRIDEYVFASGRHCRHSGGILAPAYGAKRVLLGALVIMTLGTLLVALAPGFTLLIVGRFIAGVGGMIVVVVAPQTLAAWFSDKWFSVAIGVYISALPVAVIVAFNTFGTLAKATRWQVPIWVTFTYCVAVCLLFAWKYPAKPYIEPERRKPNLRENLTVLKKSGSPVWLLSLVWMLYNASSISFMTFAGDHYIAQGFSVELAGFLTSLFMMSSIVLGPVLGAVIGRIGKEIHFIVFGCAILGIFIFLIPRSNINPLLLVGLIGLSCVLIPTPLYVCCRATCPAGTRGSDTVVRSFGEPRLFNRSVPCRTFAR